MKITFDSNELKYICFPDLLDGDGAASLEVFGPNVPGRGFLLFTGERAAIKQIIDIIDDFLIRSGSGAQSLEIEILPDRVNVRGWCDDVMTVGEEVKQ